MTNQWDGFTSLTVAGIVIDSSQQRRVCATIRDPRGATLLHCFDPDTGSLELDMTLMKANGTLVANLLALYDRWLLVRDSATGELQAVDPFVQQPAGSPPKVAWTITGQKDLRGVVVSNDGASFLVFDYSTRLARWSLK